MDIVLVIVVVINMEIQILVHVKSVQYNVMNVKIPVLIVLVQHVQEIE